MYVNMCASECGIHGYYTGCCRDKHSPQRLPYKAVDLDTCATIYMNKGMNDRHENVVLSSFPFLILPPSFPAPFLSLSLSLQLTIA